MRLLFVGFAAGTGLAFWWSVPFGFLIWAAVLICLAWLLGWSKAWDEIEEGMNAWRCPRCGRPGADSYRDLVGAWFNGEREAKLQRDADQKTRRS